MKATTYPVAQYTKKALFVYITGHHCTYTNINIFTPKGKVSYAEKSLQLNSLLYLSWFVFGFNYV
jgi:hypothetical protein